MAIAAGAVATAKGGDVGRSRLSEVLCERTAMNVVRLTDSGTSALVLALRLAMIRRPGHAVALPAFACYDLVSAGLGAGVPLVFYDLDPLTLAPDLPSLMVAAERELAAIVLVHAFGVPIDVSQIRAAVGDDILLIEDCAQAWGATVCGQAIGRAGDAAVFSFGRGKGITGGSGGALLVRDQSLATALPSPPQSSRGVRDVVWCAALWLLSHPRIYAIPARMPSLHLGETRYHPPHAVRALSDAAATTLSRSIDAVDQAARHRRGNASAYRKLLNGLSGVGMIDVMPDAEPGWLRFPVLASSESARDRLVSVGRPYGVAPGYPRQLPELLRALTGTSDAPTTYAGATELATRLLTVPTHQWVREPDIRAIITLLRQA